MGPFPHDAPPATISAANPAGTDGFEFVEFAHPEPEKLADLFERMGYVAVARHKTKNITRLSPGRHQLHPERRARLVRLALRRRARAVRAVDGLARRARPARVRPCRQARRASPTPATTRHSMFPPSRASAARSSISSTGTAPWARPTTASSTGSARPIPKPEGVGFYYLDHLTHNVYRGNMDKWFDFYASLFNFRQIRFFDIEGKHTGLHSRALTSPVRPHPHPHQRVRRRPQPDRGIPQELQGRGHPAHRGRQRAPLRCRRRAGRQRRRRSCRARPTPTTSRASRACRATPSRSRACSATAS